MKGVIWTILFILSLSFVSAFSIENVTHTSYETTLFSVIIPLDTVEVVLDNNDFNSSIIKVKVSKPLPAFVLNNSVNKEYSGFMAVNVSNYDFVRLIENNSVLYSDFILSLNTSVPIIVGDVNGFLDIGPYPFNGLVQSSTISGEKIIFIYGNAIDGEVAALRYLKKHLDEFVYLDKAEYVSDIDALSVYDYMHLEENHPYYNTDTKQFRDIVNKSLFGKVEEEVIDVKTNDGVLLRALKLKPENSQKLIEYRHNVSLPIVLARGLWSNLYSWQEFGLELADEGREVYLIEITGGPGQDCNDCVNYDFNDLINSYWPALIGTIQSLSNSSIQYVGHSNGARTGVSSLEVYNEVGMNNSGFYFNGSDWINVSMTPHPVDTFIAVGMPGA
ncbi:hypothetical protein GOV08_05095, partial [Candidatus Woesearchaeota archaeon]|nr:hypothetical protein [Candidatus Woesearchaeota archaeon]